MPRVMPVRWQAIEQRSFRIVLLRLPCGVVASSIRILVLLLLVILVDNSIDRITIASAVVIAIVIAGGAVSVVLLQRPIGHSHPMIRIAHGTNVHPLRG